MFIEIMACSDFDIPITKYILYSEKDYDVEKLVRQFKRETSILRIESKDEGCYVSGITEKKFSDYPDDFTFWLIKELNFERVKTQKVRFSD